MSDRQVEEVNAALWKEAHEAEVALAQRASGVSIDSRLAFYRDKGVAKVAGGVGSFCATVVCSMTPVALAFHLGGFGRSFARLMAASLAMGSRGPRLVNEDAGQGGGSTVSLPRGLDGTVAATWLLGGNDWGGQGSGLGAQGARRGVIGHELGHHVFLSRWREAGGHARDAGFDGDEFDGFLSNVNVSAVKSAIWQGAGFTAAMASLASGGSVLPFVAGHFALDAVFRKMTRRLTRSEAVVSEGFADWFSILSPLADGDVADARRRLEGFKAMRGFVLKYDPMGCHNTFGSLLELESFLEAGTPALEPKALVEMCFMGGFLSLSKACERAGGIVDGSWFSSDEAKGGMFFADMKKRDGDKLKKAARGLLAEMDLLRPAKGAKGPATAWR